MTPAPGIAIVIPAFHIGAGLALFAALQWGWWGRGGPRAALYRAFAVSCLGAAGYLWATAMLYQAADTAAAGQALRWQGYCLMVIAPAFFAFTALYTGQSRIRGWMALLAVCALALAAANFLAPYSLRFATLAPAAPLVFSWGEQLPRFQGEASVANAILRGTFGLLFFWSLARAWIHYRNGFRRQALFLCLCVLLIQVGASLGALVDHGRIDAVYFTGFAYLGLAALMTVSLELDMRDNHAALAASVERLEEENLLRREAEARARRLAHHDELTELPNRMFLQSYLPEMIANARGRARSGAVICIDLDHFKTIDNALGHEVGDQVLCQVARFLQDVAADRALAARMGADEFVLLLADGGEDSAAAADSAVSLAAAFARRLAPPMRIGERIIAVGASMGISVFPDGAATPGDHLRHAMMAVHRAKEMGRNNIQFFQPEMQSAADHRLELERGLRAALDNGELTLVFQPQVDPFRRVTGAEALLRWRHPERGFVSPAEFIPIAEATGLIHGIGDWVFEESCRALARWSVAARGLTGSLSVNLSAWQFARGDMVDRLLGAARRHGVDPSRLTLEITEGALLLNVEEVSERLAELRRLGFRVSLDDFGTGYSSLAYLQQLPLDELKIDQSFIGKMTTEMGNPLVDAIVAAGRQLGLALVAEGVETELQARCLARLNCHHMQGYLFAAPMAERDFIAWLEGVRATA